ncbi:MAG TPA: S24/S26 family peptidase [Dongiaceae bacterium]|nr:S24/S26 family peptidase [Dongiaceae bacterium]
MNVHPQGVRLVLDHGLPVAVDVVGGSMTPTIERGTRVSIEPIAEDLHPGDIVLILSSDEGELVLHRVVRLFSEGGQHFVIHQGDAPSSAFGTCLRGAVLGRAVGFPLTPARALPTLEVLDPAALRRFQRRRRVSLLYLLGRRTMFWLRDIDPALARRVVRMYHELAGKVVR